MVQKWNVSLERSSFSGFAALADDVASFFCRAGEGSNYRTSQSHWREWG